MNNINFKVTVIFIVIIATLNSCKVYLYDVNGIRESNAKQEAEFAAGVTLLNGSLLKPAGAQQLCDLKIVLELIAHTKSDYEKIVIDEATAIEISNFLNEGYGKLKAGKITSSTIKSTEDRLNDILRKLFDKGKQNSNSVDKTVFQSVRDFLCPADPFC